MTDDLQPWDGLGVRVRRCRERLGLSRAELSAAIGCKPDYARLIERGERVHLRAPTLVGLAEALRTNVHYLLTGELGWVSPQQTRGR